VLITFSILFLVIPKSPFKASWVMD